MLEKSIIKTLCYSHIFNFPLKADEIHTRLMDQRVGLKQVEVVLKNSKKIKSEDNFYFLDSPKIIRRRMLRENFSQEKIKKAQKMIHLIKWVKSIEAIFITGAVAARNASHEDDIDLCIVTKPGSLWTTRIVVNLIFDTFGARRKPTSKIINNKLCLNLWMTSISLSTSKENQNIYTAYEIIQMVPIFDRSNTKNKILKENKWIQKFLPNIVITNDKIKICDQKMAGNKEKFFYALQKTYMNPKITREKIDINQAYFHPRDTSKYVREKFEKLVHMYA